MRGKRALTELTENCWAIEPERYAFMLNLVLGNVKPDFAAASAFNEKMKEQQEEKVREIGRTKIAYIPLMGTLYPRSTFFTQACGGRTVSDLTREFNAALEDKDIKGILFDVDGPGGAVTGINEFANLVHDSRNIKPIHAYVGGTAASATYWITSAASKVFADATGRVGSVGTVVGVPKKNEDNSYVEITNSLSPYKRPDVADEGHYKNIVKYLDDLTDVFYSSLARNFGVEKSFVIENFGQGGIKVGSVALESKMIHGINSFAGTVKELEKEINSRETSYFDMASNSGGVVDTSNKINVDEKSSEANGGKKMDLITLKKDHPALVSEIEETASATVSKEYEIKMSGLASKNEALAKENSELTEKLTEKEKELAISKADAAKEKAHSIFITKISESTIPESLHSKVERQVKFSSFIDEKGSLDDKGYGDAVSTEIKDWEGSFSESGLVAGVGTQGKNPVEDKKEDSKTEDDEIVARLLAAAK